jgi:hypothetical protein
MIRLLIVHNFTSLRWLDLLTQIHKVFISGDLQLYIGARGGAVVETLRYKPEGHGIDSRSCHWNFSLI